MKQRPRIYYTESQKALMWDRWKAGDSLLKIAQLFDRNHSSIQRILAETGGIRPAARRRSRLSLTLVEREEISRALAVGQSIRQIALRLERAPSTVIREISRNGGRRSYRANELNKRHGIGLIARSCASLLSVRSWRSLLRRSFRFSGRPGRSLDG